jgi:hypothetical protein
MEMMHYTSYADSAIQKGCIKIFDAAFLYYS